MADHPKGAILQRDKQTYAIVPRTPVGILTPDDLESLARVARKYQIPVIKITSGQRFALVGMKKEDVDKIWEDLGMDVGKAVELCLHYVQACPGTTVCKFGVQDSLGLGTEIENFFSGMDLPAKVKIGVSGCPFCCGESFVRDIGIFGKKKGWTFIIGGSSARRPRIGDILKEDSSGIGEKSTSGKITLWLKRVGLVGFLFFLVKGLIWIFVFVFVKGQLQC